MLKFITLSPPSSGDEKNPTTYSEFIGRKMFLQKLNQGALADTGRATNDYGATAAGRSAPFGNVCL
jgi:hypothetical protein